MSGLRFPSEATMPEGMRKLLRNTEQVSASPPCQGYTVPLRANKYGAKAVVVDGIRFDSKREARYYEQLKLRVASGEIRYFLRQVPIHLPGGTRLVIDFLEFHADGDVRYVDVKGRETPAFKIKRREIEAIYPIRILLA